MRARALRSLAIDLSHVATNECCNAVSMNLLLLRCSDPWCTVYLEGVMVCVLANTAASAFAGAPLSS